jgi:FlaA1/EpsC-like NDP-sugar epimerase
LEAGAMGNRGEKIYILTWVKPSKIIDLAKKMIKLAGFPDKEHKRYKYAGA